MVRAGLITGGLLLATAAAIVIIDSAERPEGASTQIVPRRFAKYPALAGTVLVLVCAIAAFFP